MRTPHRRTRPWPDRSRGDLILDLDGHDLPVALDFLDEPGVAVGILDRHERRVAAPLRVDAGGLTGLAVVERVGKLDATSGQLLARRLDITNAQVQPVQ